MKGKSRQLKKNVIKNSRYLFSKFLSLIEIDDWNQPMVGYSTKLPDHSLCSPYSKVTTLVLYLYSMELGSPPLYAEVNRVARDMDLSQLRQLGPFLRALSLVTQWSEKKKLPGDLITPGKYLGGVEDNIAGAFLITRGAPMKTEWTEPFVQSVGGDFVHLSSNTSWSRNPKVALDFALKTEKPDHVPVLFVMTCINYHPPDGVVMNLDAYTCYPSEDEFLLMEGCHVWVLDVVEGVKIENNFSEMQMYDGKTLTQVHMIH